MFFLSGSHVAEDGCFSMFNIEGSVMGHCGRDDGGRVRNETAPGLQGRRTGSGRSRPGAGGGGGAAGGGTRGAGESRGSDVGVAELKKCAPPDAICGLLHCQRGTQVRAMKGERYFHYSGYSPEVSDYHRNHLSPNAVCGFLFCQRGVQGLVTKLWGKENHMMSI